MEVFSAGEYVGAGESFERQACAVRAATNRLYFGCYTHFGHSLFYECDDMHNGFYFLAHIVVLVAYLYLCRTLAVFTVYFAHQVLHFTLAALETRTVVVTNDIT